MTSIPAQLQHAEYRFVRISGRTKKAMDKDWANTGALAFDSPKLAQHIQAGNNYGVVGGHGNLVVIDFDDAAVQAAVSARLPPTFTVRTGGKGLHHHYYKLDKPFSGVVNDAQGRRVIDVQGPKHQVVGPGSINGDTGRAYEVVNDIEVAPFSRAELCRLTQETIGCNVTITGETLNEMLREKTDELVFDEIVKSINADRISRSPTVMEIRQKAKIADYLRELGIDNVPDRVVGLCMCPLGHESVGRQCFSYNDEKHVWFCHHCRTINDEVSGGDIIALYAFVTKRDYREKNDFKAILGEMCAKYDVKLMRMEGEDEDVNDYIITNYIDVNVDEEPSSENKLKTKTRKIVKHVIDSKNIAKQLMNVTSGWPKSLRKDLFFIDKKGGITYCDEASTLFSFMSHFGPYRWASGLDASGFSFAPREEFFHFVKESVSTEDYDIVTNIPHEPPLPRTYYYGYKVPDGYTPTGEYLEAFVNLFENNFETPIDKDIFRALMVTIVWGCVGGVRPAFMFMSPKPGCGKTTITEAVWTIYGGAIKPKKGEDTNDWFAKAIASSRSNNMRIIALDNVHWNRSDSFVNSDDFQAYVTADTLVGRKLYDTNPVIVQNIYTWMLSGNNMSYADDTAQRIVTIMLKPIKKNSTWARQMRKFVNEKKDHIIADALMMMKRPNNPYDPSLLSRWSEWEDSVLAKCSTNADAVMRLTEERRKEVNTDDDEACEILDSLREAYLHPTKFTHRLDSEGGTLFKPHVDSASHNPTGAFFISFSAFTPVFASMSNMKSLTTRTVGRIFQKHYLGGRMPTGIVPRRVHGGVRGILVPKFYIDDWDASRAS